MKSLYIEKQKQSKTTRKTTWPEKQRSFYLKTLQKDTLRLEIAIKIEILGISSFILENGLLP